MVTDDERREVARAMRDWAGRYPKSDFTWGVLGSVHYRIDGVDTRPCSNQEVLYMLADLIEPEEEDTCCDVSDDESVFKCSRCECTVRMLSAEADVFENVTYGPTLTIPNGRGGELRFCPNCGSRLD